MVICGRDFSSCDGCKCMDEEDSKSDKDKQEEENLDSKG